VFDNLHFSLLIYGKKDFIEVSKNLIKYRPENNFLDYKNNYVKISSMI